MVLSFPKEKERLSRGSNAINSLALGALTDLCLPLGAFTDGVP